MQPYSLCTRIGVAGKRTKRFEIMHEFPWVKTTEHKKTLGLLSFLLVEATSVIKKNFFHVYNHFQADLTSQSESMVAQRMM